jgi:hypothetical protein
MVSPISLPQTPSFTAQTQARSNTDTSESFDCAVSIPPGVKEFANHCLADLHMLVNAFRPMSNELTSPTAIDRRNGRILELKNVVNNGQQVADDLASRQAAYDLFTRFDSPTKGLFFLVTTDYMHAFCTETDPHRIEMIRKAISRECDQVICYQRTLKSVHTLFRMFVETIESCFRTYTSSRAGRSNWWNNLFRSQLSLRTDGAAGSRPSSDNMATTSSSDVNIPGTIPYLPGNIPVRVQEKADRIALLQESYGQRGNIPAAFKDPVMLDFMKIPVFDASHPRVQDELPRLRAEVAAGNTSNLEAYRTARHMLDNNSLERAYDRAGDRFMGAQCPTCRHPASRQILLSDLRIDVELQEEILQFLEGNCPRNSIITT